VLTQVVIGAGVDTFHLFEAEWEFKFDIGCSVGVVSQFFVIVEAVAVVAESEGTVPFHAGLAPVVEPFELFTRTNEELHLHLFEFAHTENKLTGHNLITECLTDLGDTEWKFHSTSLLYIEEVYENSLCSFRTQIDFVGTFSYRTDFGLKHQVELTYFSPVAGTRDRTYDTGIENDLA